MAGDVTVSFLLLFRFDFAAVGLMDCSPKLEFVKQQVKWVLGHQAYYEFYAQQAETKNRR
jgi:hypothetical protein